MGKTASDDGSNLVGQAIGKYRVEAVLGRGGMGVVYRAADDNLRRTVALKVLPPEHVGDSERRARFLREARSAAAVTHANIATVYDAGEEAGRVYIAMELVEGETLRSKLERGALSPAEALRIVTQIAKGLVKAHEKGIVHRDLKPENVMVTPDGDVKVLDFGLAKLREAGAPPSESVLESQETASNVTQDGLVLGTPGYMSPEQAMGKAVDHRTDTFSLGVVLYELLCGKLPFGGGSVMERIVAASRDEPAALPETIEPALREIVSRCLAKAPSERFVSTRELWQKLDAAERAMRGADVPVAAPSAPSSRDVASAISGNESGAATNVSSARKRAMVLLAIATGAIIVLVAARMALRTSATGDVVPIAASATASAPVGTSIMTLPVPKTTPEARTAYVTGLQAVRDGDFEVAMSKFAEAARADPALGIAHLRLAIWQRLRSPVEASLSFRRASELRESLSERDRALLDCMEPSIGRPVVDQDAAVRCFASASTRFPGDAEIWFERAHNLGAAGRMDDAIEPFSRAVKLDPGAASYVLMLAWTELYRGNFDVARQEAATGCGLAASSAMCVRLRTTLASHDGDCKGYEEAARMLMTAHPADRSGYRALAIGSYATGRPIESVEELLRQGWSKLPESKRASEELYDRIQLDLVRGDFVNAERRARELETLVKEEASYDLHARPARRLLEIYGETDRPREAAAVAEAFLRRSSAWVADPRVEIVAIGRDLTPLALAALARAGSISGEQRDKRRADWVSTWEAKTVPTWRPYVWTNGFARPAATREDADMALRAFAGLPSRAKFHPDFSEAGLGDGNAAHGKVYALAQRFDEATPLLRASVGSCLALAHPVELTQAAYYLGIAYETTGDVTNACASYKIVLDRWGSAAASVTAKAARQHAHALGCPQ